MLRCTTGQRHHVRAPSDPNVCLLRLLAADAKKRAVFLPGAKVSSPGNIPPGSLFLSRQSIKDWVHTGLVVTTRGDSFDSIEGNTNDAGDREGYEVCRRVRGYKNKDFVVIR